jgi:predicted nuclease of restriction endonuclease-like (RecB) superfamily
MADWCVFFCLFHGKSSASGYYGNFERNKMAHDIKTTSENSFLSQALIADIRHFIEQAKEHVAREYNSTHVLLCWLIGKRLDEEILKFQRADYGERIVDLIASELSISYGRGFGKVNLSRMLKFSRVFPEKEIVSTLSKQLSWSHFTLICSIEDTLERAFYVEMCRIQRWSVRGLKKQMDGQLYARTAISKREELVITEQITNLKLNDTMTTDLVFKDPYFIDFIGASESFSEEDLEQSILNNITNFLQELGSDFSFVARQKRMSTGKKDRYLDLLFFHRRLRRLIALDLKIGSFDPAYKGQMEWYLNWLDQHDRLPYEEKPIGIILCADTDHEDIEYLEMDKSGIHVAQYIMELPPKDILERKLKQAIATARELQTRKQLFHKR